MPFTEQDQGRLPGRDEERRRVVELLAGEPQTILITGELGVGKTSLMRAAVAPAATAGETLPLYLEIGVDWETALRRELSRCVGRQLDPGDDVLDLLGHLGEERSRIVLLLDHVEQVSWLDEASTERLKELVSAAAAAPATQLVLAVDQAKLHVLGDIAGDQRIPTERRIELERWDGEQVNRLIEEIVLANGGYLEGGLAQQIADELCADGPALPADVQRVCDAVILRRAATIKAYRRAGGASVLSTLYVERLAQRGGGWRARRLLAALAELENPRAARDVEQLAEGSGLTAEQVEQVVVALERERLLRRLPGAGGGARYALLHPYLRPAVRDLVAPLRRGRARARLALRWRVDSGGLLRPDELVTIWRFLGRSVTDRQRTKVQQSFRLWLLVACVLLAAPVIAYVATYARLTGARYLGVAPDAAGTSRAVLRRGDPALGFAFGWFPGSFGEVELDSGLALASLPEKLQAQIRSRAVAGDLRQTEEGLDRWWRRLLEPLPPVRRGALLTLAGQDKRGNALLLEAARRSEERPRATRALALLAGDSAETRTALLLCAGDRRPEVRLMAVREARKLARDGALPVLRKAIADRDPQVRRAALAALKRYPAPAALPLVGPRLLDADARVQRAALAQLKRAAPGEPLLVFDAVTRAFQEDAKGRTQPIQPQLERMRQRVLLKHPQRLAAHLVLRLKREKRPARRAELVRFLVPIADRVKPAAILPTIEALVKDKSVEVRAAAIGLQARFGQGPEVMKTLTRLAYKYRPKREAVAMRRAAATGLGLVQGVPAKDRVKLLKRLLFDPAQSVRAAAVGALLRSGFRGLREVLQSIRKGYVRSARAALDVVCNDIQPSRRIATAVLAAAWRIRRGTLRSKALGCAQTLAAASSRLAMWLADQATVVKDPVVRRAAAPAVALAVAKHGKRLARLPRIYLRDKDPGVQVAVLRALARRPPKKPGFLYRYVRRLVGAPEPEVRAATAALLVSAAKPSVAGLRLAQLLRDKEPSVWRAALKAAQKLRRFEDSKARSELGPALALVVSRGRTADALLALEVASSQGLQSPLRRAAAHPDARVRAVAVEQLTLRGGRRTALQVLAAARRDAEPDLRRAAIRAIAAQSAKLGPKALELLRRSSEAGELADRQAAFQALGRIEGKLAPEAVELLVRLARDPSEQRRRLAIEALGQLATRVDRGATALIEGALDPAHDVRAAARTALAAHLGRSAPKELLWQLLRTSSRNALQRRTAIAALAWQGRTHGRAWLQQQVGELDGASLELRIAGRLALALAKSDEDPERISSWLYGW